MKLGPNVCSKRDVGGIELVMVICFPAHFAYVSPPLLNARYILSINNLLSTNTAPLTYLTPFTKELAPAHNDIFSAQALHYR